MANQKPMGLLINGSLKKSGVTFYLRNGQMVARSARSLQPKRRTRAQFIARQQLAHGCRLWTQLKWAGEPLFIRTPTAYARFRTLMRRTPPVFVPCRGRDSGAILLLPGMPVSDGVLPPVEQCLGQVVGIPALLTSLTPDALQQGDLLRLYTLRQTLESQCPMVRIKAADIPLADFQIINGHLTLTDNSFADDMAGWALVHLRPNPTIGNAQPTYRCSSQTVVTRCTYYQRFTTEEALLQAASTYGGLTKEKAV